MELRVQQRNVVVRGVAGALFSVAVLWIGYLALPQWFEFPTSQSESLVFAIQANTVCVLWVVIAIRMVSRGRLRSKADIDGSAFGPPSKALAIKVAFLQNTLEQAFVAVGANICLATLVKGPELSLIVGSVALFSIGRVTFYLGYPSGAPGRAFGIVVTMLPGVLGCLYIIGRLIAQL